MDLGGIAALLGVPLAVAGFLWTVYSERSKLKKLERLTAIGKDLAGNATALVAVRAMQTDLAGKMLTRQTRPAARRALGVASPALIVGLPLFSMASYVTPAFEPDASRGGLWAVVYFVALTLTAVTLTTASLSLCVVITSIMAMVLFPSQRVAVELTRTPVTLEQTAETESPG